MLNFRKLRHRVTLQTSGGVVPDGQGGTTETWTEVVADFPALVEPLSGRELFNAQQTKAETTHRITTRIVATIDPTMRLLQPATGQLFNVSEVLQFNEQVPYYVLLATEQYGESP